MRRTNVVVRPGTTPIICFYLPFDWDLVAELWFTVHQRGVELFTKTKDELEVEGSKVIVRLTQEETLRLTAGQKVDAQVRIRTTGDDSLASQIVSIEVDRILRGGVI